MLVKEKFRNEKRKSSPSNKVIKEKTSICKPPPQTTTVKRNQEQQKISEFRNQVSSKRGV